MANLTRYDPFNLARFDPFGDFDDMFKGVFMRPVLFEGQPQMQIKIDLKEDDNAYTVHADIPGVKKEDIHVSVEGNTVSISAECERKEETRKDETLLCSELYRGKAARSFTVMTDVDEAKAEAKYENGILELTLPKKAGTGTKALEIK